MSRSPIPALCQAALLLVAGLAACCLLEARAQQTPPAAQAPLNIPVGSGPARPGDPPEPIHTLHVYTNLLQIPVLVLKPTREPAKPVADSRFRVSIDSGPRFRPAHVRREGDDPIALGILIDATRPAPDLFSSLAGALEALAAGPLSPRDHVTLYVMDCHTFRETPVRAATADGLRADVASTLNTALDSLKDTAPGAACTPPVPLWDAMLHVTQQLYRQRGWRVMMAITAGEDQKSRAGWRRVKDATQVGSVAVFGLWTGHPRAKGPIVMGKEGATFAEPPFPLICEMSGGTEIEVNPRKLRNQIGGFTDLIRNRYILEYPRGDRDRPGVHSIDVSIDKGDFYIRPAGIEVPLADPKILADPLTLPSHLEGAPTGPRHALQKPD